jgi:hypothetical protein
MTKLLTSAVANAFTAAKATVIKPQPRLQLVRHYVETGDERCPLAGLWTQILSGEPSDDSERTWPALGFLPLGRAFFYGTVFILA